MNLLSTFVDTLSRDGVTRHIFGEGSQRVVDNSELLTVGRGVALSNEPLFEILVLIILIFYIIWIYRYFNKQGFKSFVDAGSAITQSREEGVHTGGSSRRVGDIVMLWSLILGLYALFITKIIEVIDGILFTHFADLVGFDPMTEHIAGVGLELWMVVILCGFFASMFWSLGIIYFCDKLSRRGNIFRPILVLRSQMLLYSVIYLMPSILLCVFGAYDSIRFYVALIMVVIFTIIYLIRSFLLFHSKKISILLWILYLCAVEIFPASLVWSIFTRS